MNLSFTGCYKPFIPDGAPPPFLHDLDNGPESGQHQIVPVEPAPNSAVTRTDILSDFFTRISFWNSYGEANIDAPTPIPPFHYAQGLFPILHGSKSNHQTAWSVIQRIRMEMARAGISKASFTFKDTNLPIFFDRCGYFHQIFRTVGVTLPLPPGKLLDSANKLSPPECLIAVSDRADLEKIHDFLQTRYAIQFKLENDEISIPFKQHASRDFTVKVVIAGAPCKAELALDIAPILENIHASSPLVVNHAKSWDGLVHFLTGITKEKNWLQLVRHYTQGKRTLSKEDEAIAHRFFKAIVPNKSDGAIFARQIIKEFPSAIIPDGNAFLALALQFAISSNVTDQEAEQFFAGINSHLETLTPVTDTILKQLLPGIKKSTPFSNIQALLELGALRAAFDRAGPIHSCLTQSAGNECLQVKFLESGLTLLLPFAPMQALEKFKWVCYIQTETQEFHELYSCLMASFTGKCLKNRQTDYLASHRKYLEFQEAIHAACQQPPPMLAHFQLISQTESASDRTLIKIFADILDSPFRTNYLQSLNRSASPLISKLSAITANAEESTDIAKKRAVSFLLHENDPAIKALAYDLWIEGTSEASHIKGDQLEDGYTLLNALVAQRQWTQSLEVLRVLSKKSFPTEERLLLAHIDLYKALGSCQNETEKRALSHSLTVQVKYTLTNRQFDRKRFPYLPPRISFTLFEFFMIALDQGNIHLASDLFLLTADGNLLDKDLINVKLVGMKIFAHMIEDQALTPMFTGFFLQFLVHNNLWIPESNNENLFKLSNSLAKSPYVDSISLLSFTLHLLERSKLSFTERKQCQSLHEQLVAKVMEHHLPTNSNISPDGGIHTPSSLSEAFNACIRQETLKATQNAYILLTDTSNLMGWIGDSKLFTEASLAWLEKDQYTLDQLHTVVKNLLVATNPSMFTYSETASVAERSIYLLNELTRKKQELDPALLNYLENQHYWFIRKLIDNDQQELAAKFILALKPYFQNNSWNAQLTRTILSELPESHDLYEAVSIQERELSDHEKSSKAGYLCRLAISSFELGDTIEGTRLAQELVDDSESFFPPRNFQKEISTLTELIASTPGQVKLAADVLNLALKGAAEIEPELHSSIVYLAKKLIGDGKWQDFARFEKDLAPDIATEAHTEIVSYAIDTWLKIPDEKQGDYILELMKDCPTLSAKQTEQIMRSIASFKNQSLYRRAIDAWVAINKRKQYSPDKLTGCWNTAMTIPENGWTQEFIQEMLTYTPSGSNQATKPFYLSAFRAGLTFYSNKKGKPTKNCVRKLIFYLDKLPSTISKHDATRLFKLAINASMPEDALKLSQQFKSKVSNETVLRSLPRIAASFQSEGTSLPNSAIERLQEISDTSPVEIKDSFSIESVIALAKIPNSKALKAACSLFKRRLDILNSSQYRRVFLTEYEQVMNALKQSARNSEDLIHIQQLVVHPFAIKHTKLEPAVEDYCLSLLSAATHEAPLTSTQTSSVLITFVDLSKKMNKQSKGFDQCYLMAVCLNLLTLQKTGNKALFLECHQQLLDLLYIPLNRLKVLPLSRKIDPISKSALDELQGLISLYQDFLESDLWQDPSSKIIVHEQLVAIYTFVLDMQNRSIPGKFLPFLKRFTGISFSDDFELESTHLQAANSLFRSFAEQKKSVQKKESESFMNILNKRNAAFIANDRVTEKSKSPVISSAFDSLVFYAQTEEITQTEAQRLFDSLIYTISSDHESYQTLLTFAFVGLKDLIPHILGSRVDFFFETYLYMFNRFPERKVSEKFDKGAAVANVVKKTGALGSSADLSRLLFNLSHNIRHLNSKQLNSTIEVISDLLSKQEITPETLHYIGSDIRWLTKFTKFHASVDEIQKARFFTCIFDALVDVIRKAKETNNPECNYKAFIALTLRWLAHGAEKNFYNDDPYSLTQKVIQMKELILECRNYDVLQETLNVLKRFPQLSLLPDTAKKERADLHFQLFVKASLLDPDKSHRQLEASLNYFVKYSAVFDHNPDQIHLIRKTF